MDRDGLISALGYSYNQDPLPLLIKEGIDYSSAKKYMQLLRIADVNKNEKLERVFNLLNDNGYLSQDDLGLYELKQYDIYLFEDDEDEEIINLLNKNELSYFLLHIDELDVPANGDYSLTFSKNNQYANKEVKIFKNKFAQYLYIFSDIRRYVVDHYKKVNDVQVLIKDDADIYYVRLFSHLFKLPIYASYSINIISLPGIREKINQIYSQKSFIFTEEENNDERLKPLKEIIEHYELNEIKDFDYAYANLLEIVSSMSVNEMIDDKGIVITKRYSINDKAMTYITNFQYGEFYKVYDDKNVLTDEEMKKVGCNPSYNKTKLDRRKKLNYIRYNRIPFLSRVEQHGNDALFDSQFIEDFALDKQGLVVKEKINLEGYYTQEAHAIAVADHFDKQFVLFNVDEYRSYDHSFKGLSKPYITNDKKMWYVTNLERYISCPYRYYLSNLLPIREQDDDFHIRAVGILIHKVFEHITHRDISFEDAFKEGREEYLKAMKCDGNNKKEEAYLYALKKWTSLIYEVARDWFEHANIIDNPRDSEQAISFSLKDREGNRYNFKGRIDKIIWSKDEQDNKTYYSIVDFKTGSESFVPDIVFLGQSSQLPIYYYAIENSLNKDGYTGGGTFGGFYIQHNYSISLKRFMANSGAKAYFHPNSIKNYIKLRGLGIGTPSYVRSIDDTGFTKTGIPSSNGGTYVNPTGIKEIDGEDNVTKIKDNDLNYNFLDLVEDAKEALINNIHHILNNDFPIAPSLSKIKDDKEEADTDELVCSNCPYSDICYKSIYDYRNHAEEIEEHFKKYIKEEEIVGGEA